MSEIQSEIEIIRSLYSEKKNLIVFDIGAHTFDDGIAYKRTFPEIEVYAFEPDKFNLESYSGRASQSGVIVVPVALSDTDSETRFYPSLGHTASGSTLKPKLIEGTNRMAGYDDLRFDPSGYMVQCVRFDTFCEMNDIESVDYVHMDVQGAEYKVMSSIGNYKPKFVFAETCAFHEFETGISEQDFNELMKSLGYDIKTKFQNDTLYQYNQ